MRVLRQAGWLAELCYCRCGEDLGARLKSDSRTPRSHRRTVSEEPSGAENTSGAGAQQSELPQRCREQRVWCGSPEDVPPATLGTKRLWRCCFCSNVNPLKHTLRSFGPTLDSLESPTSCIPQRGRGLEYLCEGGSIVTVDWSNHSEGGKRSAVD